MTLSIKKLILLVVFFLSTMLLFSQQKQAAFTIRITNIKSSTGKIMVAIYNSPKTFLGEQVLKGWASPIIRKGSMIIPVTDLPPGNYAISIYHDKNGNGKLDSNIFRIPKEPYGFSNNPKNKIGPPSFKQAKFEVSANESSISIALK